MLWNVFSEIKTSYLILSYNSWLRRLFFYQDSIFRYQVVVENRILSNRQQLTYKFYNATITNFKLAMFPFHSSPLKTWVKIPYLLSLDVPSMSYAEKYDF